jgi:hypothetical protein
MKNAIVCWKCGAGLDQLTLPLSRYDSCQSCNAELHVCRMCHHHDPRWRRGCREDRAEEVREHDRANFCDFFAPRPDAWQPADGTLTTAARSELESLFGDDTGAAQPDDTQQALDKLFRKDSDA